MDTIKDMFSRKVGMFANMEENLRLVEYKLKSLSCRASDLKQEVTKAEETGRRKRKREVENWFEEVEQVQNKFNELICRIRNESLWKNFSSGESVVKICADVERLMEQSTYFEGRLWLDDHENRGRPFLVTENLFGQIFQRGWKTIQDWLIGDDLFNIGIYGMGGVGKTTLAKCIHNHLLKKTDFKVFWVTVSQNFSVKKLQDDIAKQVPLDLSGEDDENRRAEMLSMAIANHCLLILDDVWVDFSLEDVGIPVGPKCRLILTTRSLGLCNTMDCQRKFEVKCLEADEAWNLFKKTLDHGIILSVEVEKIAKLVAKECAGLPLGIITVARSMRGAIDVPEWRNVLDELKTLSIGYRQMEDKVFRILEWSFNHLDRYERLCFLYCCLYPEDCEVEREELITLFSLAELIPGRKTRKSEFDHGHTILNKLIKACLLEESITCDGKKCVKMHDLIRDMALRITSGKYISKITEHVPVFLVKEISRNESNNLLLKNEEWKDDLDAVSLIASSFDDCGDILEIPPLMSPNCGSLSTLIINSANMREIPDSFLHHMYGLKVLNLEGCRCLQLLPSCISDMVNLTALLLEGCWRLESVPPIGKLKKLRILNLLGTHVDDVPQGLEELVNLERLYMGGSRFCAPRFRARALPEGTFSKLYHLQHLVIPAAVHISDLRMLNELQLYVGGLTYDQLLKSRWLPTHYKIHIIPVDASLPRFLITFITQMLLGILYLNTSCGLNIESFRRDWMWFCHQRTYMSLCDQVKEIVEGGAEAIIFHQSSSGPIASTTQELLLPKVQKLILDRLPKIENVCSPTIMIGGDEPTTFGVDNCPKLKRLPSFSSVEISYDICGSKEWWNSLEWNNPRDKDAVQPFFEADAEEFIERDSEDLELKEQASTS